MPSYSDVQKAVNVEKRRIWFAWLACNVIALLIASAVNTFAGAPTVAEILFAVLFVLLSVTAYRMTSALDRRADRERREVLGDDYPG